jgi:iron complex outermembrane receptor protein
MKTRSQKNHKKILICIALLFLMGFNQFSAQNALRGKVINKSSKEAIPFAKISIKSLNLGSISDADGNYEFKNIPNGQVLVECEYVGFRKVELIIEIKNNIFIQNFELEQVDLRLIDPNLLFPMQNVDEVFVSTTRAKTGSPTTFSTLSKKELQSQNFAQDLPYFLESTPSTVVSSDAGAGVGYTGVRIRGVDPTRTNVTINGIPINDSESHGVFWVNMPDFSSTVNSIQVQRGVGTSTNGAAAFGASINIQTDQVNRSAYAEIDNSFGSFNTYKNSLKAGTGLINSKYSFDMRLSQIGSDGFIDRASSNLKSYFLSGSYLGKKSLLRFNMFSGKEITYQAWNGVPEAKLKGNNDSLLNHFYNNYYLGGMYQNTQDSANLFSSENRKYNLYQYENEVDNYTQSHYQLLYNYNFNPFLKLNLAAHYTHGEGYYEQFRQNDDFETYGLNPIYIGGDTINTTDLIRRRWLDNDFYGGVFSLDYTSKKGLNLILGGGLNQYKGKHFGEIMWAEFASQSDIRDKYYDNNATKNDGNLYFKVNRKIKKLDLYADLQLRNINYSYLGIDENDGELIDTKQNVSFTFFNPKGGLVYTINNTNQLYGSFSVANREPVRDDFRENTAGRRPKHETLNNLELGYRLAKGKHFLNVNYYLMSYNNQLILTGQINDVGGYTRTNVEKSYRTGLELEAGRFFLNNKLQIKGNLSLSQNKVKEFYEFIDNYDLGGQDSILHRNTDIAFSPNLIASLSINYEIVKNLNVSILSKYVSKQYLDNTSTLSRSLDAYFINNLLLNYSTNKILGKEVTFGLQVNNLFNHLFENNGYTWGYILGGKRIVENFYFPQAGINFMGRVLIKF